MLCENITALMATYVRPDFYVHFQDLFRVRFPKHKPDIALKVNDNDTSQALS